MNDCSLLNQFYQFFSTSNKMLKEMSPGKSDFLLGTMRFTFSRELISEIRFYIGKKKTPYTLLGVPKATLGWQIHMWQRFTTVTAKSHNVSEGKKTLEKSMHGLPHSLSPSLSYEGGGGHLSMLFSPTMKKAVM